MGETKIEWTAIVRADGSVVPGYTFNPWIGCTKVAPECANCYAEAMSKFRGWAEWGKGRPRKRTSDSNWNKPRLWNREAIAAGERRRVFCASLADVFDSEVEQEWRNQLFDLIEEAAGLDWLLLTKRPENIPAMYPPAWLTTPPPNVWLGTSVGHPDSTWRIGELVKVPAVVHFLSCEPLLDSLGHVPLHDIEWVIAGGESGHEARPMHPEWARSLRNQCVAYDVPFFFKQHGEWLHESQTEENLWQRFAQAGNVRGNVALHSDFGGHTYRVGKKEAGHLLDGREWHQCPIPQTEGIHA